MLTALAVTEQRETRIRALEESARSAQVVARRRPRRNRPAEDGAQHRWPADLAMRAAELIVVLACLLGLVGFGLLIFGGGDVTCVNAGRGAVVCH